MKMGYNWFMDDLQDYLQEKDRQYMKLVQNTGRAQSDIQHLKNYVVTYCTNLSSDAVASPDFIRSFQNKITDVINLLDVS